MCGLPLQHLFTRKNKYAKQAAKKSSKSSSTSSVSTADMGARQTKVSYNEPVEISLGVGTGPWVVSEGGQDQRRKMVAVAKKHGIRNLDTSRIYGESENIIGDEGYADDFVIDTKAPGGAFPTGGSKEQIQAAVETSFAALKTQSVDIYYLQMHDAATPIAETMDALQELYKQGKFKRLGLSNFPASAIVELYTYAQSKGYVLPTVYQASYNAVCRGGDSVLIPILRALNISIYAHSPIAGGFLAKTPEDIKNPVPGSRWDPENFMGKLYNVMYSRPALLDFLKDFGDLAKEAGESRVGLAYRWVRYNPVLDGSKGDHMLLGASTAAQLEEALTEIEKGPLDEWVYERLDDMWAKCEKEAFLDNAGALMHMMSQG